MFIKLRIELILIIELREGLKIKFVVILLRSIKEL